MSCYLIAQIRIKDREEYTKYEEGFDEIFTNYKGIVVLVDEEPVILEGDWPYTRTVMIRFPGEDEARRWYDSPEYQKLARHRWKSSEANIVLLRRRV